MSSIIPYTCQDSKRRPRFSSKATNFTALDAMILPSRSFLLWSVFFFPLFPPDAMPEHSELIDGDPGLGVYWESKNSFIRNYARLYWRAGAVRVSCPVQLGGRASGMKPTSFKKSSKNGTGRSIGQAVACLVMAAAITIGGAGTTFLLASQPAGPTTSAFVSRFVQYLMTYCLSLVNSCYETLALNAFLKITIITDFQCHF